MGRERKTWGGKGEGGAKEGLIYLIRVPGQLIRNSIIQTLLQQSPFITGAGAEGGQGVGKEEREEPQSLQATAHPETGRNWGVRLPYGPPPPTHRHTNLRFGACWQMCATHTPKKKHTQKLRVTTTDGVTWRNVAKNALWLTPVFLVLIISQSRKEGETYPTTPYRGGGGGWNLISRG